MQVKEIDIDTEKIKGYGICKKKYEISFLGGPTTPTYSISNTANIANTVDSGNTANIYDFNGSNGMVL